jgi:molecular chaperone DnaJ
MPKIDFKDYYQILGVDRNADEKALRSAFRKLARKHHPDINPGDSSAEERFKEINEAYEVLSDSDKRKLYDRYGEDWQRYRDAGFTGEEQPFTRGTGSPGGYEDFGSWFTGQNGGQSGSYRVEFDEGSSGFSDFFETLFGSGGRSRRTGDFSTPTARPRRGQDIEAEVDVSFDEAFRGTTRRFDVQTQEPCPTCGGLGIVRNGECPTCDGTGSIPRMKSIEVKIPAGVATGSRVRVSGQGGAGSAGGPNGDVYLNVIVRPDPRFEREGDTLRSTVDIPLYTAILGGEALVATPTGRVALTIPPGTQQGKVFRLRGQGMPRLKSSSGERGDLLARANVTLPAKLTERERELFEQLAQIDKETVS